MKWPISWVSNMLRLVAVRRIVLPCTLLLCATIALVAVSQPLELAYGGGLGGIITDSHGAVVPHAKVTAVNTETGVLLSRESGSAGNYQLVPLQLGNYNVEVVAKGFSRLLQEKVSVDSHAIFGLNLRLTPGDESKTITITDAPLPLPDTPNGATIENDIYTVQPSSVAPTGTIPAPARVASATMAAYIVKRVEPIITPEISAAKPQGAVILHVIISKLGDVKEVTPIAGSPILVKAVIDAVRQWKYRPYLVNGKPVEVETSVAMDILITGSAPDTH